MDGLQPVDGRRAFLWDDQLKGFGVLALPPSKRYPAGAKSYIVQYRMNGRSSPTQRVTIGQHGNPWTADRARDHATDLLEMVRKGVDPVEAARTEAANSDDAKREAQRLGFATYAELFLEKHIRGRDISRSTVGNVESMFRRILIPAFGNKSIALIKTQEVQSLLDTAAPSSKATTNQLYTYLKLMYGFAAGRGDLEHTPMDRMKRPHSLKSRERVLGPPELYVVWTAAGSLNEPFRTWLRLLMLTATRRNEAAGAEWEEFDFRQRHWIIPPERAKNGQQHLVPLSEQVIRLLDEYRPDAKDRHGLLFTTTGTTAISGFSKTKGYINVAVTAHMAKAAKEADAKPAKMKPWTYHDLRRSVGTGSQSLGIPVEHTEALLNHRSGTRKGVAKIYQLWEYRDEKADALEIWGRHMDEVIARKGDVVPDRLAYAKWTGTRPTQNDQRLVYLDPDGRAPLGSDTAL